MQLQIWSPQFAGFGGGIGAFSREVAGALARAGHDLRLIGKFDRPGTWQGEAMWGAGNFPGWAATPVFAAAAIALARRLRPQRILSCHLNFGPVAQLIGRALDIPYTLVAHGIDVHDNLSHRRKAALRAADRLIAVSCWTRDRLLAIDGVDASKISIVHNTLDGSRFRVGTVPRFLRDRHSIRDGEKVVLTVARLDPTERFFPRTNSGDAIGYKGCDSIIRSMPAILRECGAVRYVIVGVGSDRARLEALARDLGVSENVTLAGFVADGELPDYYRLADAFAMPSSGEGFGIVFLEAMGCGTPVLAGNVDGSVDALGGGALGVLVDPASVSEVAAGVISLLERRGPDFWFDRQQLHDRVVAEFGHVAFQEKLERTL